MSPSSTDTEGVDFAAILEFLQKRKTNLDQISNLDQGEEERKLTQQLPRCPPEAKQARPQKQSINRAYSVSGPVVCKQRKDCGKMEAGTCPSTSFFIFSNPVSI